GAIEFAAPAIHHLGEVAAQPWSAIILPVGHHIAAIAAAAPFIAAAPRPAKTLAIGARRMGLVFAVHVACDGIAAQSAQQRAAGDAHGFAVGEHAAQHAAQDSARYGGGGVVLAAAGVRERSA